MAQSELAQIEALMERYFTGLHLADRSVLEGVFHPTARYVNATPEDFMHYALDEYLAVIDTRTPPKELGDPYSGDIISIEQETPGMAFVKARMSMMGRDYLDYLTLTKETGDWRVIAKVFTYEIKET